MKNNIPYKNAIDIGTPSLFVASENFEINGLPILKDALVHYNGGDIIHINFITLEILKNFCQPDFIFELNDFQCPNAVISIEREMDLLWHSTHFDLVSSDFFQSYYERVLQIPTLKFDNIEFSSLMYYYDIKEQKLKRFINTNIISINLNNHLYEIPQYLEVGLESNVCRCAPLKDEYIYKNILINGFISFDDEGYSYASTAKSFDCKIEGFDNYPLTITPNKQLVFTPDNKILCTEDFNGKVDDYSIIPI